MIDFIFGVFLLFAGIFFQILAMKFFWLAWTNRERHERYEYLRQRGYICSMRGNQSGEVK